MYDKWEIRRIGDSALYRVLRDGKEIAEGVSFRDAVVMVENAMYCGAGETIPQSASLTAPFTQGSLERNDREEEKL